MFWALVGMVAFGFGEVIGGFIHGLIIDKLGSKNTVFVSTSVMLLTTGIACWSIWRM